MGMRDPFLTASDFAVSVDGQVSASDPRLKPLLNGASQAIRRYCGWHVSGVEEETLVLDGPGGRLLQLPTLRMVSVESLRILGQSVPVQGLEWSELGMVRYNEWPTRFRSVEITIKHGFNETPDLAQVVQQVVANAISAPMGVTQEQAGSVALRWAQTAPGVAGGISLLQRDLAIVNSYRLPRVA